MSKPKRKGKLVTKCVTDRSCDVNFPIKFRNLYSKYLSLGTGPLYMKILTDVKKAALESDINSLETLETHINYLKTLHGPEFLQNFCDDSNNPLRATNLIILVCKSSCMRVLKYLFSRGHSTTLFNLPHTKREIAPEDEDEEKHNAFYYAIRSNDLELLELLISKWPNDFFEKHSELLDEILSKAYEELKLKHVLLSDSMDIFVANKLVNLRFFSDSEQSPNETTFNNISERIEFIHENVNLLRVEYALSEVDEKFIHVLKFIVKTVRYLKQQLKCTYDVLPWEEIEFCIIAFVVGHQSHGEINFVYKSVLSKQKLLTYLETFTKHLSEMKGCLSAMETNKLKEFPNLKRGEAELKIRKSSEVFDELCKDHKVIRDIHSMETIHKYAVFAESANSKEKEGQFLIMRSLQVVGEHLKNTLGSPKLCDETGELLFSSFPQNVKQIFSDIRNSFSHAYALAKRNEVQRCVDDRYFLNIQRDIQNINILITGILKDCKLKIIETQLKKFVDSESSKEIAEIAEAFSSANGYQLIATAFTLSPERDNEVFFRLEELIKNIQKKLTGKSLHETGLFEEVEQLINFEKNNLNVKEMYAQGLVLLNCLYINWKNGHFSVNLVSCLKKSAKDILKNTSVPRRNSFQKIASLLLEVYDNFSSTLDDETRQQVAIISALVSHFMKLEPTNVKWIEELWRQTSINKYRENFHDFKSDLKAGKLKPDDFLQERVQMLKDVLQNNISNDFYKDLQYCENNDTLLIIEMLLLDILSILGDSCNCLPENLYLLEEYCPLLIGKCLRNYLAHGNADDELFSVKSSRAVILNAVILSKFNVVDKRRIGKIIQKGGLILKAKLEHDLIILTHQKQLFQALEKGELEEIKRCIKNGADIHARSSDLQTALHFAARGPSLDAIKFVVDQKIGFENKDVDGQSALHVAVRYRRKCIVEYLIERTKVNVNDSDNFGKTCLHIAAQNGFLDIVQVLLINKANVNAIDIEGVTPLFYAAKNNHQDIVSLLLGKETNINTPKILCGFTLLHMAAENGHLELTKFCLENGANVNSQTDQGAVPLHLATFFGHFSVVKVLISAGGNVNAVGKFGCTPLCNAVECGHKKVVDLLLQNGACVNTFGFTYDSPLAFAAFRGDGGVLESLLAQGAYIDCPTTEGLTALQLAATEGHSNAVQILLHNGASVNAKDNNGYSALHQSAQNGHKPVVDFLLNFGAKVNVRTKENMTPLHLAVVNDQTDIVKTLLMFGASINWVNSKNMSPLHLSCEKGLIDVTKTLIENGAYINAKDTKNRTPLHYAVITGIWEVVEYLFTKQAQVHEKDIRGFTGLHYAAHCGETGILTSLINEGADFNVTNMKDETPLHLAVNGNHRETVQRLLDKGAHTNVVDINSNSPLSIAIKNNNKEIVSLLMSKNVNIHDYDLINAVDSGHTEIVSMLLNRNTQFDLNMKVDDEMTLLCSAVTKGYRTIVQILLNKGADVNLVCGSEKPTPLHVATAGGYKDIVQMLICNKAKVNVQAYGGITPIHLASMLGYTDIMTLLVNAEADVTVKDNKNRNCTELAVAYNNVNIVEKLAKLEIVDINAKGNDDFTLLHIAAQLGHLEITKFLVNNGANVYAKNSLGSMPVHIAVREGHVEVVDFYLSGQVDINVCGVANQSLLHYAAMCGQIDMMKYLAAKKIDMNTSDANGSKPIHIASLFGFKEIVLFLLQNGAYYDVTDNNSRTPLMMSQSRDIFELLHSVGELFDGVRSNNCEKVCQSLTAGAALNVKNTENMTPLHYAVFKGHEEIVRVLLQNEADPNVVGKNGWTPLHYAAKFSHFKIVELLLIHGAMYNVMNDNRKTPWDVAVNGKIIELLEKINKVFTKVKNGNTKVFDDLIFTDLNTMNIILNAKDKKGKTFLVSAIHSDFPLIERLEALIQGDIFSLKIKANALLKEEKFQDSLKVCENVLKKQCQLLGPDNPCSLGTECEIAMTYYKLQDYSKALDILQNVHEKQKKILGPDNIRTIKTKEHIALTLHRQNKNEEALCIFKEVVQKQEEMLGANHLEVLGSQMHMGLALTGLEKYDEALLINKDIFEKSKKILGFNDHITLSAYNNIAMVLGNQGKFDDAMDIYKVVYEKRKNILGPSHSVTLHTLRRMAQTHLGLQNFDAALEMLENIFNAQKNNLGLNNIITLQTWCEMADIFLQGKRNFHKALEMYREILMYRQILLSPWHPDVVSVAEKINSIEMAFAMAGNFDARVELAALEQAKQGVIKNDKKLIEDLLMQGLDVNQTDSEGRTLLHYAVDCAQTSIISFLLENKANCIIVTKKGNTPLHIACLKNYEDIVETLLQHMKMFNENKLSEFVNAATFSSSSTALHVTTNVNIVKALLKCGAMFNKTNKDGKKLIDLASDPAIIRILKLLEKSFEDIHSGNSQIIDTLLHMDHDMFILVTNSQNSEGKTLNQIATLRNHHHIGHAIVEITRQNEINVNKNYKEYSDDRGWKYVQLKEIKNSDDLCKYMIGENPSDPFRIMREAEWFMIFRQHVYDQAVKVFKKLLQVQPQEFGFLFLEIRGLLTEGSDDDFGMHHKIVGNNFHNAASEGEEYVLKHFLTKGFNINTQDNKGRTALHYASYNKQNYIVYFLLENGADCLLTSEKGNTALHIASSKGHGEIVEILLQHTRLENIEKLQDLVNAKTSSGTTALHVASDLRIAMALLRCGAIYNAANNAGQLPINLVKDKEIVNILMLLNKLFEAMYKGNSLVIDIFSQMDSAVLSALANALNHEGKTLCQVAIVKELSGIAYFLKYTPTNKRNLEETCILRYVTMDEHKDEIADVKNKICSIHTSLSRFHRAQLNRMQELFIHHQKMYEMTLKSYETVMKILGLEVHRSSHVLNELKNKCSVKPCLSMNVLHRTVHKFVEEGDVEAGKILADIYDIDRRDSDGNTLLHYAVLNSQKGIVRYLLCKGISCMNISFDGNTPLHLASNKGDTEIVEILIKYMETFDNQLDTFINKQNSFSGNTALHVAANFEIVKILLKNGGCYNIKNKEGRSPIDLLNEEKTVYILKLIDNLFKDAQRGDLNITGKLKQCNYDDFTLVVNTLNNKRKSIIDVLEDENHSLLLHQIRELQKTSNQDFLDIVESDSNYLFGVFPRRYTPVANWTYCVLL